MLIAGYNVLHLYSLIGISKILKRLKITIITISVKIDTIPIRTMPCTLRENHVKNYEFQSHQLLDIPTSRTLHAQHLLIPGTHFTLICRNSTKSNVLTEYTPTWALETTWSVMSLVYLEVV